MKVLRKATVVRSRKGPAYLKTERTILEAVKHPFIVGLQYAFQTDGKLYLIMNYLNGGELFYHLSKKRYFSEQLVRFYAAEIVLAISHLHSLGIVYRDLKPENLCLDTDGHVVLTDFGLAKEAVESDDVSSTSFCGTAEYMAPEILNRGGHGRAVDWWSLGTLVYEMLTGTPPFSGGRKRDEKAIQNLILTAKAPIPKKWSPATKDFVRRLLEKDASKRLGSGPNGDTDIMMHPFFDGVDWDAVYDRQIKPPYKPVLPEGQDDASNFDPKFTNVTPVDSPVFLRMNEVNGFRQMDEFHNFSYVAPSLFEKTPEEYPRPSLVPNTPAALAAAEQDRRTAQKNAESENATSDAVAVPAPGAAPLATPAASRPQGTAEAQPAFYTGQRGSSIADSQQSSYPGQGAKFSTTSKPSYQHMPGAGAGSSQEPGRERGDSNGYSGSYSNGNGAGSYNPYGGPPQQIGGFGAPAPFNPYAAPFAPLQWGHRGGHHVPSNSNASNESPPPPRHHRQHSFGTGNSHVNAHSPQQQQQLQEGAGGTSPGDPAAQGSPDQASAGAAAGTSSGSYTGAHGHPVSFYQPQQLRQSDLYYNHGQYRNYGPGPYGWR
eukprot:TRINITY_DN456_c0_g1_i2.p1 TRINITY_DN456_c0_g1~~TRINITY_DN456_c0_g1_i2.p1  ORF type:complete len:601 (+),score=105.23 TRINITY_DN456_c0_g1_i2:546-2348(+)